MAVKRDSPVTNSLIASLLLLQALSTAQISAEGTSPECSNNSSRPFLTWRPYQDSCYSASGLIYTYEAGKDFCRQNGGSLASVHSRGEMQFILSLVGGGIHECWIGLRKTYPLEYKWEDGTPVNYVNWFDDDDDDDDILLRGSVDFSFDDNYDPVFHDIIEISDKCASFSPPEGSWLRGSCDHLYCAICKFRKSPGVPEITTTAPAGFCSEGWYTFGDSCYKIGGLSSSESSGWHDASYQCEAVGSQLVSVHSAKEQDFLNTRMLDVNRRMWIGLSRPTSQGEFSWKDDSPLDYSNWDAGEPNNHLDTEENCVQLLERPSVLGRWNDAPCRLKFPYICKKPRDTNLTQPILDPSFCAEPEGWLKIRDSCYKVFNEVQSPTSWTQAQYACTKSSAILASVRNFRVTAELRLHMTDMDGYFWIGISSTAKHRYTWFGGAPLIYSNWESGQPEDVSDENNCVAMNTEGEWMVRNCSEKLPFICEVNEGSPEPPELQRPSSNLTCPKFSPKWHDLGGKYCYIFEVQEKIKWYEASCACSKEGGNLASFHSTDEIDLMVHYVKDYGAPLHIGFERNRRGSFVWADGSPTDFDNWNSGQPNSDREQCTAMDTNTGKWNDIQCGERHGYICSVPKVPLIGKPQPPTNASLVGPVLSSSTTVTVITVCTLSVLVIAVVALCYYYPSLRMTITGKIPFGKLES